MGNQIKVQKRESKIGERALEVREESSENLTPFLSFRHVCKNYFQLSDWRGQELAQLISAFKKIEGLCWKEIKKHAGLNYKPINRKAVAHPIPITVPRDATIEELKVDDEKRLIGFRVQRIFYLIWFDRAHEALPEGKVVRK